MNARKLDPFRIAWWLFIAWVVATYGYRLVMLLLAEFAFDIDTGITDRDFVNYWVGGRLALSGDHALLFDHDRYYAYLQSLFGADYQVHSWSYPPHFLLLVAPLGGLSYAPALTLFLCVTFALFAFSLRAFAREFAPGVPLRHLWLALAGYVLLMIETSQNGFLTSAMLLTVFGFMRSRPALAGFALALLTVKPQLGFLIPLLALFDRNWALLRWATLFTVLLVAASIAVFGIDSWRAYFEHVIPYQNRVMTEWVGGFLYMMPSTFGALRALEAGPGTALAIQAVVSVLALGALLRMLFVLRDPLERVAALLVATFLVSPYSFDYDMGALNVVAACLALRARARGDALATTVFGALTMLPAALTALGLAGAPVSPLVLAASLTLLWSAARRSPAPGVVVSSTS